MTTVEQLSTEFNAETIRPDPRSYLIMTETDPQVIEKQIAAGLEHNGSARQFLNNFADNFPQGRRRPRIEKAGYLDKPRQETANWNEWQHAAHSALIITKTYRQFYEDIDKAIKDAASDQSSGFNGLEFEEASGRRFNKQNPASTEIIEEYSNYILPIYLKLRAMGYSHYDLWQ